MTPLLSRTIATAVLAAAAGTACTSATRSPANAAVRPAAGPLVPGAKPAAPDGRYPYTRADVHFMTGMIAHHAQAVVMAGWAASHGASAALQRLCERIVVGQTDEIGLMQTWLGDRGEAVPSANATRMKMKMGGMEHEMLMPGMLTDEEMGALDKARGVEFDRLFLLGMIKHHQGAIDMVNELNASPGAAQDDIVFKFSNDVYIDQTTEIERMQKMLTSLQGPPR
ncbi:MAG TPA: DUF305 domain-containing protein [Gemmatimonadaceae bacterium]|nr:DUF305 domain-containing protein [Gemmatimonadaceae bacterium]